jgi:hypothetical protein
MFGKKKALNLLEINEGENVHITSVKNTKHWDLALLI